MKFKIWVFSDPAFSLNGVNFADTYHRAFTIQLINYFIPRRPNDKKVLALLMILGMFHFCYIRTLKFMVI